MKKWLAIMAAAALALALAGCGQGNSASSSTAEEKSSSTEASAGIPNPWSDAATAEEAGKGAGFEGFTVPDALPVGDVEWAAPAFSFMEGIAQADYDAAAAQAIVRKGSADFTGEMLHGVYETFEITWTHPCKVGSDTIEVTCNGYEKGTASLMEWSANGYNYSVYIANLDSEIFGIAEADMADVVASIQ